MRKLIAGLILSTSLMFAGCKPISSTAGQPTPFMKVVATNDALATSNDSIVDTVTTLNASATLTTPQAAAILQVQKKIAEADLQLTTILNQGPAYSQVNVATINALISQIKQSASILQTQDIIPNDPQAQTIMAEVSTVITLATTVTQELLVAGIK